MFDLDVLRPPEDVVGAVVPLDLDVGSNDDVAMAITHLTVYPVGFGFGFTSLTKQDPGAVCADELELARNSDEDPVGLQFHLGVEFADGRRADSLANWISINGPAMSPPHFPSDPLTEISLRVGGAGGYNRRYSGSGWVWPLRPDGPLAFWVGWPAAGLPSRPSVIDASMVLDAVGGATTLWSEG
jgi:hypothetical protein